MSLVHGPQCCCDECCNGFIYERDGCEFTFHGNEECNGFTVESWVWEEINLLDEEDEYEIFSEEREPDPIEFPLEGVGQIASRLIRLTETLENGKVCVYTKKVDCTCEFDIQNITKLREFGAYIGTLSAVRFNILPGDVAKLDNYYPNGCTQDVDCDVLAGEWTVPYNNTTANGPTLYSHRFVLLGNNLAESFLCGETPRFSFYRADVVIEVVTAPASVTITVDVRKTGVGRVQAVWTSTSTDCAGGANLSFPIDMQQVFAGLSDGVYTTCGTLPGGRQLNVEYVE